MRPFCPKTKFDLNKKYVPITSARMILILSPILLSSLIRSRERDATIRSSEDGALGAAARCADRSGGSVDKSRDGGAARRDAGAVRQGRHAMGVSCALPSIGRDCGQPAAALSRALPRRRRSLWRRRRSALAPYQQPPAVPLFSHRIPSIM